METAENTVVDRSRVRQHVEQELLTQRGKVARLERVLAICEKNKKADEAVQTFFGEDDPTESYNQATERVAQLEHVAALLDSDSGAEVALALALGYMAPAAADEITGAPDKKKKK